ncbi:MAG TPA: DUF551 domain-containing protein [Acinetobacter sp.]|nr:DUF551 domain-containing protein [Acinetobacter sp.]
MEWISVDEQLPESELKELMVIVCICGVDTDIAYFNTKTQKFLEEPMGMKYHGVTHWMPLPASPKEHNHE